MRSKNLKMEKSKITDQTIAAFLEGNATTEEVEAILSAAKRDSRFREYLSIVSPNTDGIPMLAQAAASPDDNLCNVRCEQYVLQKFGITALEEELKEKAAASEWLKEGGTPLFRVGSICADYGLCVSRRYYATLKDIKLALEQGSEVIVAIDGGEIDGNEIVESIEDRFMGEFPDHCICVLALEDGIVAYNPNLGEIPQRIARDRFIDAWRDSKFYMVSVNRIEKVADTYSPAPLNLDDVTLPEELDELTEAIAENTHEVWSKGRMDEGWTYGAERDDDAKKHPDLLPYSSLTEGEKEFDRATAMNAIKLIVKLGYRIEKN